MKKFKKITKYLFVSAIILLVIAVLSGTIFYHKTTHGLKLNDEKLGTLKLANNLEIYDINGEKLSVSYETFVNINKLSSHTKNAFISAEDKRFYSHNGVDYIRIAGAIISNIKSKSFSEGASTISQQLIKNTQLTSEKTLKRKLKEIKLTKQLENKYSKHEILEMYLNNIYFGNGCYGIENASKHYFGKSSTKLTLAESALLAGTINAPSIYDIEDNPQKAKQRRNLILNLMLKHGKITKSEKIKAENEEINLNLTDIKSNGYVLSEIIKEACAVTGKTENQLKSASYKIHTYYDSKLNNQIKNNIKSNFSNIESNPKTATIVIDNKTGGIVSITGNKLTHTSKKQPGSTIKPILVYAPLIESNKISPATKILDEKININGYSPENADKKYHGYVSVREALKNSYNIPAVKLMAELGVTNAHNFAKKLGIYLTENDQHLAIALGGLSKGITLKTLTDAYSAFANNGEFQTSKYIKKITFNGTEIYTKKKQSIEAMSPSTAYLITNILCDTSKSGTGKRLKDFPFEIATKTGTVGIQNSTKNSDAFSISFTTNHTILSYLGETQMPENINGATHPTIINKNILNLLYNNNIPKKFTIPDSVEQKSISLSEYKNNTICETHDKENSFVEFFSKSNPPSKNQSSLSINFEIFNFENQKPIICFFASKNYSYKIFRKNKNEEELIFSISNLDNKQLIKFEDKTAVSNEIYEYQISIYNNETNKEIKTKSQKLKSF